MSLQKLSLPLALAAIALLSTASTAWSSTDNILTAGGTADYALPGNWSASTVPYAGHNAIIGSGAYSNAVATLTNDVSAYVPDQLMVGYGGTGEFDVQTGGNMTVNAILVGYGDGSANTSTGILRISGGTITNPGRVRIGSRISGTAPGAGTVYQTAGLVSMLGEAGGVNTMIGAATEGTWNISGGTLAMGNGYIGYTAGVTGALNQTGGVVSATDSSPSFGGHFQIGSSGIGTYDMSAGSLSVSCASFIGFSTGGTGTLDVHGAGAAEFTKTRLTVGYQGTGIVNVRENGTLTLSAPLQFGYVSGGTGQATFSGNGIVTVNNAVSIGNEGTGMMAVQDSAQLTCNGLEVGTNTKGSGAMFQLGGTVT
ncbi:MAG: hypothetical protein ABFC96_17030, partial [Thermoguttaceae bacterium]